MADGRGQHVQGDIYFDDCVLVRIERYKMRVRGQDGAVWFTTGFERGGLVFLWEGWWCRPPMWQWCVAMGASQHHRGSDQLRFAAMGWHGVLGNYQSGSSTAGIGDRRAFIFAAVDSRHCFGVATRRPIHGRSVGADARPGGAVLLSRSTRARVSRSGSKKGYRWEEGKFTAESSANAP